MLANNFSKSMALVIFELIIFELNIQLPAQRISHPALTLQQV